MPPGKNANGKNTSDRPGKTSAGSASRSDSTGGGGALSRGLSAAVNTSFGPGPGFTHGGLAPDQRSGASKPGGAAKQTEGGGSNPNAGNVNNTYTAGSVENYPDANLGAVADLLSGAVPGLGLTSTAYRGAKLLAGEDATFGPIGDALGADRGKQQGFTSDQSKGFNDNDDARGETGVERSIAGESLGAGTLALTGDQPDSDGGAGTDLLYSDIELKDRRKPRTDLGAGSLMALGLA